MQLRKLMQVALAIIAALLTAGLIFGTSHLSTSNFLIASLGQAIATRRKVYDRRRLFHSFHHTLALREVKLNGHCCFDTLYLHSKGFAALKNVLIKEGVYSGLCDSEDDADLARRTGRACVGQDLQVCLFHLLQISHKQKQYSITQSSELTPSSILAPIFTAQSRFHNFSRSQQCGGFADWNRT